MRARRVLGRVALTVAFILVLLIGVAAVVSQTAAFRDWLRRTIVARLNAGLNGEIAVGRIDGNLFQRIVLTDLRVRSEGRRVLAARRVEARYDLLGLVAGHGLVLRAATIDGLALTLVADDRGWNVARLYPPRPSRNSRARSW